MKEVLPADALIFTDVGWNKNGVGQQYGVTVPETIFHPSGLATMGFGAAAVIGAKLVAPEKVVVTLVGDGGFGTNPSVLATAREMNLPIIWVVMNNSAFGTIAGLQTAITTQSLELSFCMMVSHILQTGQRSRQVTESSPPVLIVLKNSKACLLQPSSVMNPTL